MAHVNFKMLMKFIAQHKMMRHAQARRLHWMICAIVDFLKLACACDQSVLRWCGEEVEISQRTHCHRNSRRGLFPSSSLQGPSARLWALCRYGNKLPHISFGFHASLLRWHRPGLSGQTTAFIPDCKADVRKTMKGIFGARLGLISGSGFAATINLLLHGIASKAREARAALKPWNIQLG